jgi:hypothetical protein
MVFVMSSRNSAAPMYVAHACSFSLYYRSKTLNSWSSIRLMSVLSDSWSVCVRSPILGRKSLLVRTDSLVIVAVSVYLMQSFFSNFRILDVGSVLLPYMTPATSSRCGTCSHRGAPAFHGTSTSRDAMTSCSFHANLGYKVLNPRSVFFLSLFPSSFSTSASAIVL